MQRSSKDKLAGSRELILGGTLTHSLRSGETYERVTQTRNLTSPVALIETNIVRGLFPWL